jgi:putative SOS response-associated peptidase YedK
MCGRYVLEGPLSRLTAYFDARYTEEESHFKNSYNIAPLHGFRRPNPAY